VRLTFGGFSLNSDTRQLLRGPHAIHVSPKAFDLLSMLIERRPAVVTRPEIQRHVWPGTFVEDANLSVLIAEIRRALGDDPKEPRFVRTVHGRGYAFCGAADDPAEPSAPAAEPIARCWLAWHEQARPLVEGENVIGRDPRCEVWIDARGVSRRHARVVVRSGDATLEDLASTNGTFLGPVRVAGIRQLQDGDIISVGAEALTFRVWSEAGPPPTERVGRRR
jgi:DNA-binding winged helix-turn-helix (wHTH) protein